MIDRFRSLPMARSAFLAGRTLADLCRSAFALVFIIGLGLLVGFRFHNGVGACLGGIALIILFGYSFTWVYASVGLAVKDPQTAQMAAILPMFILFFASSALVPVATMPGWLLAFCPESAGHGGHRLRARPSSKEGPSPTICGRQRPGAWGSWSCSSSYPSTSIAKPRHEPRPAPAGQCASPGSMLGT